jgi:hypothetical protein
MSETTYVLIMEDVVFGISVNVGVLTEAECNEIAEHYAVPGEWVPCVNGCCHSRQGLGDFGSVIFKRVPTEIGILASQQKIESLREEVAEMANVAAQMTAEFTLPDGAN